MPIPVSVCVCVSVCVSVSASVVCLCLCLCLCLGLSVCLCFWRYSLHLVSRLKPKGTPRRPSLESRSRFAPGVCQHPASRTSEFIRRFSLGKGSLFEQRRLRSPRNWGRKKRPAWRSNAQLFTADLLTFWFSHVGLFLVMAPKG